ncbi:8212_t:CDS:2, partial [Gigaspora margarita]
CGTRDYGIEELENQIENSKSGKVQNISNQPNALSQELLNLDNHNQEPTRDEPGSKNATSSPSLSIEEEFTRETLSFNKNKIKCTIWDILNEISAARIRKSLSFYGRTTIQSIIANGKSKAIYRKLNKQKDPEISDKENRPVVSYSYKNTYNGNISSKGIHYRKLAGSSQQVGWPLASKSSNPSHASDVELRIALHNINGLKANSQKMDA